MQFCLGDLQPDASQFITRYFEKRQLLEPVCELYFSTIYKPDMYLEQRFLALAHAIEAYHRAFVGGKYQPTEDYRTGLQQILWNAIPQTVDADFRSSLRNKLKYLHEFSLRKRVQDICTQFSSVLLPYLGAATQFAGAVADQRNLLTHPDLYWGWPGPCKRLERNMAEMPADEFAFGGVFAHEIGFSEEAISNLMPRNRRTRTIQLNRK